jgi:hypothetical protein
MAAPTKNTELIRKSTSALNSMNGAHHEKCCKAATGAEGDEA